MYAGYLVDAALMELWLRRVGVQPRVLVRRGGPGGQRDRIRARSWRATQPVIRARVNPAGSDLPILPVVKNPIDAILMVISKRERSCPTLFRIR